jgi:hypothetical protein
MRSEWRKRQQLRQQKDIELGAAKEAAEVRFRSLNLDARSLSVTTRI